MRTQLAISILFILCGCVQSAEFSLPDNVIPLWNDEVPAALGTAEKDTPFLIPHLADPKKTANAAVVICPGGGYGVVSIDYEGTPCANWFNSIGVSAFVLRYRLPAEGYPHPVPLLDIQHAIRLIRSNAEKWNIDSAKIGVIGFSAGGHLASTAGTHFQKPIKITDTKDPIDAVSCRPDFMILVYPVISMMDEITHIGSRDNLIGKNPDSALVELMSSEKQVTPQTPPTFLVHTSDDKTVRVDNSVNFYLACLHANVPVEMHLYLDGGHGFWALNKDPITIWSRACQRWLQKLEFSPLPQSESD